MHLHPLNRKLLTLPAHDLFFSCAQGVNDHTQKCSVEEDDGTWSFEKPPQKRYISILDLLATVEDEIDLESFADVIVYSK